MQFDQLKRREFITLFGSAALWPIAARGQQPAIPVLGYLFSGTADGGATFLAAFRKGLTETGYVEGRDVSIEFRWADNQVDRLPAMAADLVRRRVALIVASPTAAAQAAKAATTTIPIVFQIGGDPVKLGLVSSFNRPGGNLTGVSQLSATLAAKRLELLHNLIPNAIIVGMLADPQIPTNDEEIKSLQQATRALGLRSLVLNGREIDSVFENLARQNIDALFVMASTYFFRIRNQITQLAARHKVPVIYEAREFTEAGGLVSYGSSFSDVYRQVGFYAGRILRGENPRPAKPVPHTKKILNNKTTTTQPGGVAPRNKKNKRQRGGGKRQSPKRRKPNKTKKLGWGGGGPSPTCRDVCYPVAIRW